MWILTLALLAARLVNVHPMYTVYIQVNTSEYSGSLVINYMVLSGNLGSSGIKNINTNSQGVLSHTMLASGMLAVISNVFTEDYGYLSNATIGNYGDSLSMTSMSIYDVTRAIWSNITFTGTNGLVALNSSNTYTYVVNGVWSTWSSWSACSQSCGYGNQTSTRQCNNPPPANGGTPCNGPTSQYTLCNSFPCPVDGVWQPWSPWSACSVTCGSNGVETSTRVCTPPTNGGLPCSGNATQTRNCQNVPGCPVDGVWQPWSAWSACSVTCGSNGTQTSTRVCILPINGGLPCSGNSIQTQNCANVPGCPVDGQWSPWGSWSPCSVTCGLIGLVTSTRTCTNPAPSNGGRNCIGSSVATNTCTNIPTNCPVNGAWGAWSPWSSCSVTCGAGFKTQTRSCDSPPPQFLGTPCSNCATTINGTCGLTDQNISNCTMPSCLSITDFTKNALSNALSLLNNTGNTTMSDKATMQIAFNVVNQVQTALMSQLSNSTTPVMVDTSAITVGLANLNPNSSNLPNISSTTKGGISISSLGNISSSGVVQFSALQASTFFKSATPAQAAAPILSLGISSLPQGAAIPITMTMPNQNSQTLSNVMVPLTFLLTSKILQTIQYDSAFTVFQLNLNLQNVTKFTLWFSMSGRLPNISTDADAAITVSTIDGSVNQNLTNLNLQVSFTVPMLQISIPSGQMAQGSRLLLEMFTVPTNNSNDTATIQLGVTSITPRQWNYALEVWQDSNAQVDSSSSISNVVFKSNFLGTFSAKLFIPPNMIDFKNVFSNFATLLANSFVVLIVLILLIIGYIILGVIMWRKDRKEASLLRYEPLLDNDPEHEYTYILNFHTSGCRDAGTTSKVFINILGKWGSTSHRKVEDGFRTDLFSTGSVCNFVLTTESTLGELLALRVWHNSTGLNPAWHLEKIIIEDMQTKKMYIFMCDSWLAEDRFDSKTERVLLEIKRDKKFQDLFYRMKVGGALDKHVLLTLVKNTGISNYTRLQKLSVFVTMFFLIMVSNAMFFGKDSGLPAEANFTFNLGIISMTWFQIYTGIISVAITYPCIFLAAEIFRRTKRWNRRWTEDEEINLKKEKRLPKGFVAVGWFLLMLALILSIFFTFLYSLQWGNDKSNNWLQSFFLGVIGMIIFTDPIILLFIHVLVMKIFGAVSQETETNIDSFVNDDIKKMIGADLTAPVEEKLEKIRKEKENAQKLSTVIQDALSFAVYLLLLTALAYDARDSDIYLQNQILKAVFLNNAQSVINTYNDIYTWTNSILDQIYPILQYNQGNRTGDIQNTIRICDCLRQGPFRLRQLRVQNNTCVTSNFITNAYGPVPCNQNFNTFAEQYFNFGPNWASQAIQATYNNSNWNNAYISPSQSVINAFTYQNASQSGGYPFQGTFGLYEGGGYVAVLGMSQSQATYVIRNLNQTKWIDKFSKAIFFEGTVYNWNSNLFSTIQILFETPNSGGTLVYPYGIRTYRLYDYTPGKMIVLLAMQILYLIVVIVTIYREIKRIIQLRLKYFSSTWNQLELLCICLSICIIITSAIRIMSTINSVTKLNNNVGSYVAFDDAAMWVETTCGLMAVSCFFAILRMLKYMGFNKYISMTKSTLSRAWEQLSSFALALVFFTMAYFSSGHVLFAVKNVLFSDLLLQCRSLFASFLGMMPIGTMFETPLLPENMIYYFSWSILALFFLMSVVVAILNETYADVVENEIYEYDKDLVDHMWAEFNKLSKSLSANIKSSIPNVFAKKGNVAPVDMDDVDIMMGSRESVRLFNNQRINPSVRRKLAELNREKFSDLKFTKQQKEVGNEVYINHISFTDINLSTSDSQIFDGETFADRVPRFKARGNAAAVAGSNLSSVIQPTRPVMRPTIDFTPKMNNRQRRASKNAAIILKGNSKKNSQI